VQNVQTCHTSKCTLKPISQQAVLQYSKNDLRRWVNDGTKKLAVSTSLICSSSV